MSTTYLTKTLGTPTLATKATCSMWFKSAEPSGQNTLIASAGNAAAFYLHSNSTLRIYNVDGSALTTNRVFTDPSAWYHLVVAIDTTQVTASNRVKVYINGIQETSFSAASYPNQNSASALGNNSAHFVGSNTGPANYFNGYMNNVAFVDGTALTPTSFGETDSASGIWKFKSPSGITWGNNGFHLKMDNSANLGLDSSGETNNFTLSGNGRQAKDTPTNVYATLNSLNSWGANVLSNGNLTITSTSATAGHTQSTMHMNKGKWYMEFNIDTHSSGSSAPMFILAGTGAYQQQQTGFSTSGDGAYGIGSNGRSITDGVESGSVVFTELVNGDKVQIAFDADAGKAWFGINDIYLGSGNPSTGANPYFTTTKLQNNDVSLTILGYDTQGKASCNFGNGYFGTTAISSAGSNGNGSLFEYDVPSGYYALNTKNINTYG